MATDPSITPPDSVEDALIPIVEMTNEQFDLFVKAVHESAFALNKRQLKTTALLTAQTVERLSYLTNALAFLYHRVQELRDETAGHKQAVSAVIESLDVESDGDGAALSLFSSRLERCLEFTEKNEKHWKVAELKNGYLPTATEFSSIVDFRPVFVDDDGDMRVDGCIISAQFRIITDSPFEKDSLFVFQITEDGLEDMSVALARLQAKIAVLRDRTSEIGSVL